MTALIVLLLTYLNSALGIMSPELLAAQLSTWEAVARPDQLRPADCRKWWNLQAGRAFGKTRAGSEHTINLMEMWGPAFEGGICSKTANDVRRDMIEGPSGLLACALRRGYALRYLPSKRMIVHPSGARLYLFSGDVAGDTRGFSGNYFWADELPHWQYAEEAFSNVDLALRAFAPEPGPHGVITSTPKRRSIISALLLDPKWAHKITTTRGSTRDNVVNLAPGFLEDQERTWGGSWRARQEIDGELITDNSGGFTQALIDAHRKHYLQPHLVSEIVIAIDPAVTSKSTSDDTGIVAIAAAPVDDRTHYYPIRDMTFSSTSPGIWIRAVLQYAAELRSEYHGCRIKIVIEDNQGGETWDLQFALVSENDRMWCPLITRVTARASKIERADAAAILYEQGRVHHVGPLTELEQQMTRWVPGMDSPDRMDALVHGLLELSGTTPSPTREAWRPTGI